MKKYARKFTAGLLALAVAVSLVNPVAFAASEKKESKKTSTAEEITISSEAEANLAAARIMSSLMNSENDTKTKDSKTKKAIKKAIFSGYNDTTDLSKYNISSKKMDSTTEAILEENNLTDSVSVNYETDSEGNVTTAEVEMDAMVTLAADELKENATVYKLTEEQTQELLGMYAQYIQLVQDNADMFGVEVPYNTTKDTNSDPIGSMLDIASISKEMVEAGYVGYDVLSGLIQLYYLATQFSIEEYKDDVIAARDEALSVIDDSMTTMQKYLALNGWLANNCQFAMDSIMDEMVAPEPEDSELYTYAYECMYNMIYNQVYQGTYDALKDAYGEDQAKEIATQQAKSYMEDVQDEDGSGEQQAASTASSIIGLWRSNQVGTLVAQEAVCFGYASVFRYLVQCANPSVYLEDPNAKDLYASDNWKSYEELNFELDTDGNPKKDENGDYIWSVDGTKAIVDLVKIIYDTDVSMFGSEEEKFDSPHYWNAVKVDGEWYYVDPCYTDIYIECMNRNRVETDGNLNHLYFMFSDTSARDMYEDNYEEIRTLYENIATDQTYEDAWFAFAKSQIYFEDGKAYYLYDSTDMLDILNEYGGMSGGSGGNSSMGDVSDYEGLFEDTEYKVVYHDASKKDSDDSFVSLVDFNEGTVYNPDSKEMEDNDLIADLYAEFEEYVQEYPAIAISTAYYSGKLYFSLSNTVLSYDLETGEVEKLIEYTTVSGERDMSLGLGGLGFTKTSSGSGDITVENPPIADMTIKEDGQMYVSIATNYGFISGKNFGELTDYSSYGYQFAETNYNPAYSKDYGDDEETNDNDEFMWSANIVDTIDMGHLTGSSHSYKEVTVGATCTEDEYKVSRCETCGKIEPGTTESGSAKTLNGEGDEEKAEVASLDIVVKYVEDEEEKTVSTTLTEEKKEDEENKEFTFKADDIKGAAEKLELPEGYALNKYEYKDVTVAYGEKDTVELTAAQKATATLKIVAKYTDGEEEQTASTELKEEGPEGDEHIFTKEVIQEAAGKLEIPEGYVLSDYEYKDVTVAYGKSDTVELTAEKPETTAIATLEIVAKYTDGEEEKTVSTKLEEEGAKGEEHTFMKETIQGAAEKLELPEGYVLNEYEYKDVKVAYGEKDTVELTAAQKATATLRIVAKYTDGEEEQTVSTELKEEGPEGDEYTFTKAVIQEAAEKLELPEGYVLSEYEYKDVKVAYGKSDTVELTATKETAKATLNITVFDADTVDSEDEDVEPTVVYETSIETEGSKGETIKYTADDIKDAVEVKVEAKGYKLDEDSLPEKDVEVICGDEAGTVELTATLIPAGTGHRYVKFTENFYTKTDGHWNSGTSYACIDCGHAFDEDEYDDNFREGFDTIYELENASETTEIWTWSTDGTEAALYVVPKELVDHKFDCVWENSSFSKRYEAEVTHTDDCTNGSITYTATANGKTATKKVTIESKKHTYNKQKVVADDGTVTENGAVTWTWASDLSEATLTLVCDVCGKETKTTVKQADMQTNETAATCTEDGSIKYTATVEADGVKFISSRSTATEDKATGHAYGDPVWNWPGEEDGDYSVAEATFTCDNNAEHTKTVKAEGDDITKTVNRKEGTTTYTATVTLDGKEYTTEKTVDGISEEDRNPFVDVDEDAYYYDAVIWAYENGITTGKDDTHFAPSNSCTRSQVVTFLWRTMGEPEPKTTKNPFVDVDKDAYYYKAVLWAYENGITTGKDDTHFAPNAIVTRGQFVTFLHRQNGEPEPNTTKNPFVDVSSDKYYYKAVLWAYENGITTGKDDTHFLPDDGCTRAQVVTFLYRAYGDEEE